MSDSRVFRCTECSTRNRVPAARIDDDPKCGRCQEPLFPAAPVPVGDADFERRVASSSLPVLVDFWAPWCGPCRTMEGPLESLARERRGRLTVAKVNVDECPTLAARYQVRSIPALKLMRDGEVVAELIGAVPAGTLSRFVDEHLAGD